MTTMGVTVFCNRLQINGNNGGGSVGEGQEQLMLLRTLQDNESNILSNQPHLIVPKSGSGSSSVGSVLPPYDPSRLKKHGKNGQPPPVAVARRNARERNRVKQVNNGFATLRQHIPGHIAAGYGDRGKKLSKVETLRMAVEYIRGLQRLLAEADGLEYDPNAGMGQNVPSPTSSIISSSHNGSGERLVLDDEHDDEDVKPPACLRLSPMVDSPAGGEFYSASIVGDEENLEPVDASRVLGHGHGQQHVNFSRLSPTSVPSPCEFYAQNEENLEPRQPLSPYSGGDSEEGGTVYAASPEAFAGALYYKQEIPGAGDMIDVVSWWEQEQGRLNQHTQHLTHA